MTTDSDQRQPRTADTRGTPQAAAGNSQQAAEHTRKPAREDSDPPTRQSDSARVTERTSGDTDSTDQAVGRPERAENEASERDTDGEHSTAAAAAADAEQTRPGRRPAGPAHPPKGSMLQTAKRTWSEFSEDNLTDAAAALTYYAILSIFPALLALVAIVGLVGDPQTVTKEMTTLVTSIGPKSAAQTFKGPIQELTKSSSAAGILVIVGIASALWTASGYVGAFMRASNVIYEVEEGRSVIKLRPLQMLVTLVLVILLALTLVALVLTGPLASKVGAAVGIGASAVTVWNIAKWPVLLIVRHVHDRAALLRVAERQATWPEIDHARRGTGRRRVADCVRRVRVLRRELRVL